MMPRIAELHVEALVALGWPVDDALASTRLWLTHAVFDGEPGPAAQVIRSVAESGYGYGYGDGDLVGGWS